MGWFGKKRTNEDVKLEDKLAKKKGIMAMFSKKRRRIASVFLYERVGKNEIFVGSYPLLKGIIKDLGEYVVIDFNGKSIFMNVPHYNDYTASANPKIGKIIEVVKFAEDDYRVRNRLSEEYSAEKFVPKMKSKEVCSICDNLWDKCSCKNKDEENMLIIKVQETDKTGKPVFEKRTVVWEEPKGVTQEGRDSIRSMNNYIKRMEEHRKKNEGFWAKYGGIISFIITIVICTGLFVYTMNVSNKNLKATADAVKYSSDNAQWWKNPDIIKSIGSAMVQQQDEAKAPPT